MAPHANTKRSTAAAAAAASSTVAEGPITGVAGGASGGTGGGGYGGHGVLPWKRQSADVKLRGTGTS